MWSKSMLGYGPEDTNFVLELTYNYGVAAYKLGNDFGYLKIRNRVAYANLEERSLGTEVEFNVRDVRSPDGHTFRVLNEDPREDVGYVTSLCLHVTDLDCSLAFWADTLGFLEIDKGDDFVVLSCGADQATLRLAQLPAGAAIDHGTGYGRVAYSCPTGELRSLQEEVQSRGHKVLTPLVSLDTPGKATVQVVILADPDGHEICFVGDEEFRQLSQPDDNAGVALTQACAKDGSREWLGRKRAPEGAPGSLLAAGAATAAAAKPASQPAAAAKPTSPPAAAAKPDSPPAAAAKPASSPAAAAKPASSPAAAAKPASPPAAAAAKPAGSK
ncbi:Glyoxalase domain-containing 4 [Micractinium conductrix]|uniref:Glyoxalase domain-containing 4 n=1 Tax=Micractinium conductrix TaxID=554055 RepID=A0A2P6VQU9_9CHLO|nr:Glyoxalase domain-containing 4 [Micractinium conductrix]|eukprot:PSC76476.1 Glyoxalase domain-containing 4 [Micractinium conductrix]